MPLNEIEVEVRFYELDPMRIAHHSVYYHWFEIGMFNFFSRVMGITQSDFMNQGYLIPVIESQCKYIKPARYGETIRVRTKMRVEKKAMFQMHHELFAAGNGTVIARGSTTHAFISPAGTLFIVYPKHAKGSLRKARSKYPKYFL